MLLPWPPHSPPASPALRAHLRRSPTAAKMAAGPAAALRGSPAPLATAAGHPPPPPLTPLAARTISAARRAPDWRSVDWQPPPPHPPPLQPPPPPRSPPHIIRFCRLRLPVSQAALHLTHMDLLPLPPSRIGTAPQVVWITFHPPITLKTWGHLPACLTG